MLNNMLTFWRLFLDIVANFLSREPIIYFVALFMLCVILRLFIALIKLNR